MHLFNLHLMNLATGKTSVHTMTKDEVLEYCRTHGLPTPNFAQLEREAQAAELENQAIAKIKEAKRGARDPVAEIRERLEEDAAIEKVRNKMQADYEREVAPTCEELEQLHADAVEALRGHHVRDQLRKEAKRLRKQAKRLEALIEELY
jgi:polyribonucleotide nucleotidyltransferase